MKVWKVLEKPLILEASISLKSEAPEEVVNQYEPSYSNKLVAWIIGNEESCGVIQNNRSVCAQYKSAKSITLYEIKPAKGCGWVGITINDHEGNELATLLESRHSEKSLSWLKTTQEVLADSFGLKVEFEDRGWDA
ncbi:hypothetical protein HHX48_16600 [Salinimonas sp. HHU 13199]|uniref:Uncharacterized protein n=1 Tax=Salinimonas profundi TaxID=2729140 RepID=A0ABR8LME2_9ALTE|nr:hypothetical protein [Salinimonas profundi]MBD3587358.1 hypothetical protein [Salinimonas profundi]